MNRWVAILLLGGLLFPAAAEPTLGVRRAAGSLLLG